MASSNPSNPRRGRATPCQVGRNRASASGSTGSICFRSKASERDLIQLLGNYPATIEAATREFSPAHVANYGYEVAKQYNKFYHEETILKAEDETVRSFRLHLSAATARIIANSMQLLGIEVPDRM